MALVQRKWGRILDGLRRDFGPAFDPWRKAQVSLGCGNSFQVTAGLYRFFLREYPSNWPALRLPFSSHTSPVLMWQHLFYQQRGIKKGYGDDHRGFCYMPISTTLERAGFMTRVVDPRSIVSDPVFTRFGVLLTQRDRADVRDAPRDV
ncbi:hypothetical protein IV102_23400 [bacterium]|nr:hypothetical protein [bacterium]